MEDNEKMTLATELLHEIKASAKRWFIAFLVMCGIELATIAGFMWYLSLPVDEYSVSVDNDDGNANYIGRDLNGVIDNGNGESELQEAGE